MRCVLALTLLGFAASLPLLGFGPAESAKPKKAAAAPAKHSYTKPVKSSSSAKGKSHTRARKGRHTKHVSLAPSYQLHPDPERYQEIQQALASRGFFKGAVNGVWGDDSVDALKGFQTAQKISDNDGKINALSLNALGLGAKHDSSALSANALAGKVAAPEPPPPPAEQAAPDESATPGTPPSSTPPN